MTDSVDWIENRLEVTGPDQALQEFVMAAEGPGVVLWERPAGEDLAYWSALLLQGGAPSPRAADKLARRYEDKVYLAIEDARTAKKCFRRDCGLRPIFAVPARATGPGLRCLPATT
jgi:hypothetical protein